MRKRRLFLVIAIAAALSAAAFAQDRPATQGTLAPNQGKTLQEQDKVSTEGTIQKMTRENNGYRIQLERGGTSYWVPDSAIRDHENDFRVGASIRFGGIFRGGVIYVDIVDWPDERGRYSDQGRYPGYGDRDRDRYDTEEIHGYVDRVDLRRGTLRIHEESTRRHITIDMSRVGRQRTPLAPFFGEQRGREYRLSDLHRGDYIELSGRWTENIFVASHIDNVEE